MFYLKGWSIRNIVDSPHAAPELTQYVLVGCVYGHPGFADGTYVMTSEIDQVHGRIVKTISGSTYSLEGLPEEGYLKFLRQNSITFNEKDPLNFKR